MKTNTKKANNMKAYKGIFIKKNGERRAMRFVKLDDLPKNFVDSRFKGTGKRMALNEGSELVWDIDESDFRIFNYRMAIDNLEEFDYTLP